MFKYELAYNKNCSGCKHCNNNNITTVGSSSEEDSGEESGDEPEEEEQEGDEGTSFLISGKSVEEVCHQHFLVLRSNKHVIVY